MKNWSKPIQFRDELHWLGKGKNSLPVKIQSASYSFDVAESECDYQIAL